MQYSHEARRNASSVRTAPAPGNGSGVRPGTRSFNLTDAILSAKFSVYSPRFPASLRWFIVIRTSYFNNRLENNRLPQKESQGRRSSDGRFTNATEDSRKINGRRE